MREVDVVYLVEHAARELDVACAVKHQAKALHGLEVEVLPVHAGRCHAARNLHTRTLAVPYAYRVSDGQTHRFAELFPGAKILNLAWEQVVYRAVEAEKVPSDAFTRGYVLHHAWSEQRREVLLEAGVPDAHVFVNGNPAYGLYDPPYRQRSPSREEIAQRHALDPGRKWLLFAENYWFAFSRPERLEALARSGVSRETLAELAVFCDRSLRIVLGWLAELASHGFEVILRPRPATPLSDYARFVEATIGPLPERLRLIKEGPVRQWILASDVVASSHSTTLIEAALAGKGAFMALPEPLPPGLEASWYALLPKVVERQAFLDASRTADPARSQALAQWARRTLLGSGDPIRGVAALLARIADPAHPRPPLPPREAYARGQHGWRALPHPGDGPRDLPYQAAKYARYKLRRWREGLGAPRGASFQLDDRHVPARAPRFIDPLDVFDASVVDRITREWGDVLG